MFGMGILRAHKARHERALSHSGLPRCRDGFPPALIILMSTPAVSVLADAVRNAVVPAVPYTAATVVMRGRACGAAPAAPVVELDAWLAEAQKCGISPVETFAAGLEVDGAAVSAALTEPWSSGQAEGQVNRLKLLKRQNYGRASFDLLRRRVLLAA